MNFKIDRSSTGRAGFSLVEILVVILVIGIIAGIAVPLISSITGRSREATARRHAQVIASMATNALHAGNSTLTEAGSKDAALTLLGSGVEGTGSFENVRFRLELNPKERAEVIPYLDYKDGLLVINPSAP